MSDVQCHITRQWQSQRELSSWPLTVAVPSGRFWRMDVSLINKLLIRLWAWFTHLLPRNILKIVWGSDMHLPCIRFIHFHARLKPDPIYLSFFFLTLFGICFQNPIWVSQGCYWLSMCCSSPSPQEISPQIHCQMGLQKAEDELNLKCLHLLPHAKP